MKKGLILFLLVSFGINLHAADKPTAAEANKIFDFYQHGQGIVLLKSQWCGDLSHSAASIDCHQSINPGTIAVDRELKLWMAFMVPQHETDRDIIVQFEHKGVTRMMQHISVAQAMDYRAVLDVSFNKRGDWTIKIIHDKQHGVELLATLHVTVI